MEKILTIKCFDLCTYQLDYPAFFLQSTLAQTEKLFKWMFRFNFFPENQETISFLSEALPVLVAETSDTWNACMISCKQKMLPLDKNDLPQDWTGRQKVKEIARRRELNQAFEWTMKNAEVTHRKALKLLLLFNETKTERLR